ncbi:MAG: N-acetyltransferase [Gammaproteobacteria bacterium]|nr:MAG: N-acetyltransferase [Gammaproteobacteria bacterium]
MDFSRFNAADTQAVIALFTDVFSASEGDAEGRRIGQLVSALVAGTPPQDLLGYVARAADGNIVGCIFFSRFWVPDGQTAFLLSPVAIATPVQGTGIGQQLIRYGLQQLASLGVALVFTYGDPAFYGKTGFMPISEQIVAAPCAMSQPEGWLAQSLDGRPVAPMHGATRCVDALADPQYW